MKFEDYLTSYQKCRDHYNEYLKSHNFSDIFSAIIVVTFQKFTTHKNFDFETYKKILKRRG